MVKEYTVDGKTYLVCSEREATKLARERIREDLWAFRSSFIGHFANLDGPVVRALQKMQGELCEDSNEIVYRIIGGTERKARQFADEAIAADGRGHFLSSYDGEENESDSIEGLPKGKLAYRIG